MAKSRKRVVQKFHPREKSWRLYIKEEAIQQWIELRYAQVLMYLSVNTSHLSTRSYTFHWRTLLSRCPLDCDFRAFVIAVTR